MPSTRLTLDRANIAIAAALAKGRELGLRPMSAVIADAGGHPIAFARQDGASNHRFQIAMGKASGALGFGTSSRMVGAIAGQNAAFISALAQIFPDGLVPTAGGIIIVDDEGLAIGAIGVTGDTAENDETCAMAGISGAGLTAQS